MSTVRFYGCSDDLIEVDGTIPGCDEYNDDIASFVVAGLTVTVSYGNGGTWGIHVGRISEDVPVTAEEVTLVPHDNGYSMELILTVPDGSFVQKVASVER